MFVFKIAKKLNIIQSEDAYSLTYKINYLLPRMANKSEQWGHLLFIPGVNFIVEVALWMEIAKKLGKSKIWGLFMIVPILNFVSIWHLSNSDFQEPTLSTGPR
jgi:Na+/melibiose symporter-like transporter